MGGRKYRTSIYKKATKNIDRRKKEAIEIINKSRMVDTEIYLTKLLITIIVVIFVATPFIIVYKKKHMVKPMNDDSALRNAFHPTNTSTTYQSPPSPSSSLASNITNSITPILAAETQKIINETANIL